MKMLEIKPVCENCGKSLPNGDSNALICSFECTFCRTCVDTILFNVCPNCGGGFVQRPTRPKKMLQKYPVGSKEYVKPIVPDQFEKMLKEYKDIDPHNR